MYLSTLLKSVDIIALQEHWLFSFEKYKLEEFAAAHGFSSFVKCVDDDDPISAKQRVRGWGGCALLWRKEFDQYVVRVQDGSDRLCCITLNQRDNVLCIISTYMPTTGSKAKDLSYESCLDEIQEICQKYCDSQILLLGDMNASFTRMNPTNRDRTFMKAMKEMNFCAPEGFCENTFHHHNDVSSSQIDYILPFKNSFILKLEVLSRESTNTSTHDPVITQIHVCGQITQKCEHINSQTVEVKRINWETLDILKYQRTLQDQFEESNILHLDDVQEQILKLSEALNYSTLQSCEAKVVRKKIGNKRKPQNPEVRNLIKQSKEAHWKWKSSGGGKDCTLYEECKSAKKQLRKAQRQLEATIRNKQYTEIMESHSGNKKLFYTLIRKQRNTNIQSMSRLVVDGTSYESSVEIGNVWADYFEQLSRASVDDKFDEKYKCMVEQDLHNLRMLYKTTETISQFTTVDEILLVLNTMSNGKAPDELSVMVEHLKYGGIIVARMLEQLFNKIYTSGIVPEIFKSGIITPIYKKQGKPLDDPNSYRRITVCSIIGKVFEKILQSKIIDILDNQQSKLQRGFTKDVSASNAGLLLTEAIAEAKDSNHPLYAVFIDASKAFDVVWHASLLRKLHVAGVTNWDWIILDEWYKGLSSKVKWDGELSRCFREEQGVRQGGILSPLLYKVFINPLLKSFEDENLGYKIGSIHVGSPACADDVLLMSKSLTELQIMLLVQEHYANNERYFISESKSKVMMLNHNRQLEKNSEQLLLHNKPIEQVDEYTHIGIQRNALKSTVVSERIKLARRTSYALMGAGLHGYNGINPIVSIQLWNIYVRPRLIYGLESVVLQQKDIERLTLYYKTVLKNLQCLPERTADVALYVLTGQLPILSTLHYQILVRLGSILRNEGIEKELCTRQLLVKDSSSKSWFIYAKNILDQYNIVSIYELLIEVPPPGVWKRLVRNKINQYWIALLENEIKGKTSLKFMNCKIVPGLIHNLWSSAGHNCISIKKASIKARLVTGTYTLQSDRAKFYSYREKPDCKLCLEDVEDRKHFILECGVLKSVRTPFLLELKNILMDVDESIYEHLQRKNLLLQLLLDCTHSSIPLVLQSSDVAYRIESLSRGLCFALHRERCARLEIHVG